MLMTSNARSATGCGSSSCLSGRPLPWMLTMGEKEPYAGCDVLHECEPTYCHVCEAHFMAWRESDPVPGAVEADE
jgi:hypothetical protein